MVGAQQLRGELPALSGQPALHRFWWGVGAGRRGGQGAGENGSVTAHHAGDVGDRSVGLAAATVPAGEDLPRPVRVGAEPGDRQIGALRGGFLPRPGVMPAARARPRHSGCRRECTGRRRCRHRLLSAGPSPDGGLVEVTVDSGAGNGEHGGDLGDGVLPGVIQPLGEGDLVGAELGGAPPRRPRARAAASPSRVLATISSRCSSASTDNIPNMARPSAVPVLIPCSTTCRPTPRSRSGAPKVTRCKTERPRRSNRVTTSTSPSRSTRRTRSSFGRDAFAPLA